MMTLSLKRFYFFGALLYALLLPFHQQVATFALGFWLFASFVSFRVYELNKNWLLFSLPILFFIYVINSFPLGEVSIKILEHKLSLLAFPIVFFLHRYSKTELEKMMRLFVIGLAASSLFCLGIAMYNSLDIQQGVLHFNPSVLSEKDFFDSIIFGGNYFFGKHLSVFHQTVYFSIYLCIGVVILLFNPQLFGKKSRKSLLFFLTTMVFLISNKASFIVLGLIICLRLFTWDLVYWKKILGFFSIIIFMGFFIYLNPRSKESIDKIAEGKLTLDSNARYGFSTRLLSWDAALTLIKNQPLSGYGTTNTQKKLNEVYGQKKYIHPLKESYNAHNQWLQTWLENGLVGFLVFSAVFSIIFYLGFISRNNLGLFVGMALVLFVNSMFESIFNRFSGISFFSFIVCFIFSLSSVNTFEK
ncbi:O-antigen ligase family protein [Flagellimonas sp.]|jgi:O-antigen ligase|uniref:O-antigen ligase family protein n=1 Tax=Flagellimonas sp. TaxID=2058762 RepID=UPI003BA9FC77